MPYRLLLLDGVLVKWGTPTMGSGAVVRFAVVEAPADYSDARNCKSVTSPAGLLERNRISSAQFDTELEAAFATWSAVTGIAFRRTDPDTADILIAAEGVPIGRAFTNVSRGEAAPGTNVAPITRAVICLNPSSDWKVGFDGNLNSYDLRYTLEHEIGHAIGLDHPGVSGEVMDFRYRERFRDLQAGDVAGGVALYGSPLLVNNATSALRPLITEVGAEFGLEK